MLPNTSIPSARRALSCALSTLPARRAWQGLASTTKRDVEHALGRLDSVPNVFGIEVRRTGLLRRPAVVITVRDDHSSEHVITVTDAQVTHVTEYLGTQRTQASGATSAPRLLSELLIIPGVTEAEKEQVTVTSVVALTETPDEKTSTRSAQALRHNVEGYLAHQADLPQIISYTVGRGLEHVSTVPPVRRVYSTTSGGDRVLRVEMGEHVLVMSRDWIRLELGNEVVFGAPLEEENVVEALSLVPGTELVADEPDKGAEGTARPDELLAWFARHTRDLVVATTSLGSTTVETVLEALPSVLRVPDDISVSTAPGETRRPGPRLVFRVGEQGSQSTVTIEQDWLIVAVLDGDEIDTHRSYRSVKNLLAALALLPGVEVAGDPVSETRIEDERAARIEEVLGRLTRGRELAEVTKGFAPAEAAFLYTVRDALTDMADIDAFDISFPEDDRAVFAYHRTFPDKPLLVHTVVVNAGTLTWTSRGPGATRDRSMIQGPATAASLVWVLDVVSTGSFAL